MFARSEKVATFASAFEKNRFPDEGRGIERGGCKSRSSNGKCKVLEKIFAGLKKIVYLCSPFASQNAEFFQRFFELLVIFERKNVVFICQFPLRK